MNTTCQQELSSQDFFRRLQLNWTFDLLFFFKLGNWSEKIYTLSVFTWIPVLREFHSVDIDYPVFLTTEVTIMNMQSAKSVQKGMFWDVSFF